MQSSGDTDYGGCFAYQEGCDYSAPFARLADLSDLHKPVCQSFQVSASSSQT